VQVAERHDRINGRLQQEIDRQHHDIECIGGNSLLQHLVRTIRFGQLADTDVTNLALFTQTYHGVVATLGHESVQRFNASNPVPQENIQSVTLKAPQTLFCRSNQSRRRSVIGRPRHITVVGAVFCLDDDIIMPTKGFTESSFTIPIVVSGCRVDQVDASVKHGKDRRGELAGILCGAARRTIAQFRNVKIGLSQTSI